MTEHPRSEAAATNTQARLDQAIATAMQPYVDAGRISGVVTHVAHRGEVVHQQAMGWRDIEADKPMQVDTLMRIYSMTKPVTSTAVMMLIERGELALTNSLADYLPEFADLVVKVGESADGVLDLVPAERPITIEHLLTHTSGFSYGILSGPTIAKHYADLGMATLSVSLDEFCQKLSAIPLASQPGTEFSYSVSTAVLGRVIEVISGQTLDVFLGEQLLTPLGMHDTGFYAPTDKLDRFAKLYTNGDDGSLAVADDNRNGMLSGVAPKLLLGDGGLVSTAPDFNRFCHKNLNKGELDGHRVLEAATVELMTQNQLPANSPHVHFGPQVVLEGVGFGYGFAVTGNPKPPLSLATGTGDLWWGGYSTTVFWVDPGNDTVCILMAQQLPRAGEDDSLRFELQGQLRHAAYTALKD